MERKELKIFFIWPTFTEIGRDLSHLACGGGIRGNVRTKGRPAKYCTCISVGLAGWRLKQRNICEMTPTRMRSISMGGGGVLAWLGLMQL